MTTSMAVNLILNNIIDIYAILWCIYLILHATKTKHPKFLIKWSFAQIILFTFDMTIRFVNKGFCLFSNCEPTITLTKFFDGILSDDKTVIVRFLSMTLMFVAVIKQHKFIEHLVENNTKQ